MRRGFRPQRRGFRWWLDDLHEDIASRWEVFWLCKIRNRHHVKMGSYPNCYRCGRTPRHIPWRLGDDAP